MIFNLDFDRVLCGFAAGSVLDSVSDSTGDVALVPVADFGSDSAGDFGSRSRYSLHQTSSLLEPLTKS